MTEQPRPDTPDLEHFARRWLDSRADDADRNPNYQPDFGFLADMPVREITPGDAQMFLELGEEAYRNRPRSDDE